MEHPPELAPFPVWPKTLADILALPSVDDAERASLPDDRGLYFALVDRQRIDHVGVAGSFQERWKRHEKLGQLRSRGALSIAFLPCPSRSLVSQAEVAAIWHFRPALNWQIRYPKRKRHQSKQWPTPAWVAAHPDWTPSHSG